jgi:hypothetical protein
MYKMHSRNFKTTKIKNLRKHRKKKKGTQTGLQQTAK